MLQVRISKDQITDMFCCESVVLNVQIIMLLSSVVDSEEEGRMIERKRRGGRGGIENTFFNCF